MRLTWYAGFETERVGPRLFPSRGRWRRVTSPAAGWGLASAGAWGAGDFAGGVAAKRAPALRVALVVQVVGAVVMGALALALRDPLPGRAAVAWAALAGASGAVGVSCLYTALASGRMGIAAPISGLVAAIIPVAVAIAWEGRPPRLVGIGFLVALAGVMLVSAPNAERPPARVLVLGVLAGVGFAGFLLAVSRAHDASLPWVLSIVRVAAGLLLLSLALGRGVLVGNVPRVTAAAVVLDTLGNAFFLLATRAGRLDIAVVTSSLYPVATVLLARWTLKERLTRWQTAGAIMVLAGIPLISL